MDGRMNNTISIEKREAGTSGRCVGRIDGVGGPAELHFTIGSPKLISADHTEAPASMCGTGAAMALVEHMIGDARASGFKIIPICPLRACPVQEASRVERRHSEGVFAVVRTRG
jgi:predicted GNAT family acetyltransferase